MAIYIFLGYFWVIWGRVQGWFLQNQFFSFFGVALANIKGVCPYRLGVRPRLYQLFWASRAPKCILKWFLGVFGQFWGWARPKKSIFSNFWIFHVVPPCLLFWFLTKKNDHFVYNSVNNRAREPNKSSNEPWTRGAFGRNIRFLKEKNIFMIFGDFSVRMVILV